MEMLKSILAISEGGPDAAMSFGLAARLAAHYSALRGYALEGRRYMWKVDY